MAPYASVVVSEEFLISLTGKFTVQGLFTTDIVIPSEPYFANQLVFLFSMEANMEDPFQKVTLEVTFPQQPARTLEVPLPPFVHMPGRTRWVLRWPFLIQNAVLVHGRIDAKVIHEKGELVTAAPWISLAQQAPPMQPS
jgi:hypothetical protein